MARDQHAARQIDEAAVVPFATLYKWRDHREVDATWGGDRGTMRLIAVPITAS
jgi:hypothetical protein